ncbi:MAG: hypothetical protein RLY16_3059 [Bacteroidota bacterium]|jgi:hypothetical protein
MKKSFNIFSVTPHYFVAILLAVPFFSIAQNVGIGISNPQANLHINTSNPLLSTLRLDASNSASPLLEFCYGNAVYGSIGSPENEEFEIKADARSRGISIYDNSQAKMIYIADGKMSLGGHAPGSTAKISVFAPAEAMKIDGENAYLSFYNNGNYRGYIQAWVDGIGIGSAASQNLRFYTNSGAERLTILANGNIGVNNNNPNYNLDVNGSLNLTNSLYVGGSAGNSGNVLTSNGAGNTASWSSPTKGVYESFYYTPMTTGQVLNLTTSDLLQDIPGLTRTFTLTGNTLVQVSTYATVSAPSCFGCGTSLIKIGLIVNNNEFTAFAETLNNNSFSTIGGNSFFTLPAGTHTIKVNAYNVSGAPVNITPSGGLGSSIKTSMSIILFRQ